MSKVIYIDVETTGLSAVKQDVIQVAALIEIDGKVICTSEFKCAPHAPENAHPKALAVHGYPLETIKNFPDPFLAQVEFVELLKKFIDPYDKEDKFTFAGYNAGFDFRFMRAWFEKCGNNYFNSFFDYKVYDIYPLFRAYAKAADLDIPNHKLVTAAAHFGLEHNAHDALSDIVVTREIGERLQAILCAGIGKRGGAE